VVEQYHVRACANIIIIIIIVGTYIPARCTSIMAISTRPATTVRTSRHRRVMNEENHVALSWETSPEIKLNGAKKTNIFFVHPFDTSDDHSRADGDFTRLWQPFPESRRTSEYILMIIISIGGYLQYVMATNTVAETGSNLHRPFLAVVTTVGCRAASENHFAYSREISPEL